MRTTLLIKQIDMWAQIIALLIPVGLGLIFQDGFTAFCAYFSVGAVQAISALMHSINSDRFLWSHSRGGYNILLTIILTLASVLVIVAYAFPGSGLGGALMGLMFLMLGVGPLMAIWYFTITVREMLKMQALVDRKQYV